MFNVNIDEGAGREVALLKESGFWGGAPGKFGEYCIKNSMSSCIQADGDLLNGIHVYTLVPSCIPGSGRFLCRILISDLEIVLNRPADLGRQKH